MNTITRYALILALALASTSLYAADRRVWIELELIEQSVASTGVPDLRSALLDIQDKPTPSNKVVAVCAQRAAKVWVCDFKDLRTGDIDVWHTASGALQTSGSINIKPLSGDAVTVPFSETLSYGKTVTAPINGAGVTFILSLQAIRHTNEAID